MHHKAIKAEIKKQLKTRYPNWQCLTKKEKKAIAKKVLDEAAKNYDFKQEVTTPLEVLLGIESQLPTASIMNLDEMGRFIEGCKNSVLFKLNRKSRYPLHIKDEELRFINDLLDDKIINKILSYDSYTPAMRDFFPSNFLRAELLKAVKHPEISYRKFCGDDNDYKGHKEHSPYIGMDNKQNRAFIGLPLNRKQMLSHAQMCQFRAGFAFSQLVNLMVYIIYHLRESGILDEGFVHCVDSTELPVDRQQLLAVLKIKGFGYSEKWRTTFQFAQEA